MKCSNCNCLLFSSDLKFSCSHFLCNKCLSRQLLLNKFEPLSSKKLVELTCSCKGNISVPFGECLKCISEIDNQKKYTKFCKEHKNKSDKYCPSCRLWLCEECISSFHNSTFKNHILCPASKLISTKCFYHKDYTNEIFCKDCNKFICKKCQTDESDPDNIHTNHATITLNEYKQIIKKKKKNLRFKNYDQCAQFINIKQEEIIKDFSNKCDEAKKIIDETIQKLGEIKKNYILKFEHEKNRLRDIFLIIKKSYENFYLELEQENAELDLSSFNFITKINSELNNIIYKPKNFDQFETINSALKKIDISSYYDVKFIFGQNNYDLKQSIDIEEGVTSLCTLKSFEKSFACGTDKGKIKIFFYNEEEKEYEESGNWSLENSSVGSITSLIELNKIENTLISGSNDKTLRIFRIEKNENKCKITFKNSIENDGIILDIFQINDGRIAYSTSDNKIKILKYDNEAGETNVSEITNNVCFEKSLAEVQYFENDENNKKLVSGGRRGGIKIWDISSKKSDKNFSFGCKLITCIAIINNHKIAIGTENAVIIIFDYFDEKNIKYLYGHKKAINAMCYSNSIENLFSCSKDLTIKIWDLETLKCIKTLFNQHTSNIYDITFCDNELISCSNDGNINIYSSTENNEENYDDFD